MAEDNPWSSAFKELYKSTKDRDITGKEKSDLFRQLGKVKKDMDKTTRGASRGPSKPEIIDIPDPAPSIIDTDISPSEKYRNNFSDIKWDKKAKGGLIGSSQSKGQGKVMRHKTTKHY